MALSPSCRPNPASKIALPLPSLDKRALHHHGASTPNLSARPRPLRPLRSHVPRARDNHERRRESKEEVGRLCRALGKAERRYVEGLLGSVCLVGVDAVREGHQPIFDHLSASGQFPSRPQSSGRDKIQAIGFREEKKKRSSVGVVQASIASPFSRSPSRFTRPRLRCPRPPRTASQTPSPPAPPRSPSARAVY